MHAHRAAAGYNERLFAGGLRRQLHLSRFKWARNVAQKLPHKRLLEIGCHDGRLLDYISPEHYVGVDANWEGGLDKARSRNLGGARIELVETSSPASLDAYQDQAFDLGVALETLEHVSDADGYLRQLARLCDNVIITVPNEKGLVFLAKWAAKALLLAGDGRERYSPAEIWHATTGQMHKVPRREHKGFDYAAFIEGLKQWFVVTSVVGLPIGPPRFAFGVAVIAYSRRPADKSKPDLRIVNRLTPSPGPQLNPVSGMRGTRREMGSRGEAGRPTASAY
ncbi:MAG: class I SAM-dependent methyltransferase [Caulobacteraceae bacterium]